MLKTCMKVLLYRPALTISLSPSIGKAADVKAQKRGKTRMLPKPKCPVIAIEEHYWDAELASHFTGIEAGRPGETQRRLDDLGALRIKEMDDAGIDIQVLSHGAPSAQKIGGDIAVDLTRRVNDRLHQAIAAHPTRFACFAALPTAEPEAAADELERCVVKLGFKGAMIHGLAHGKFVDDRWFWPIYARA